MSEGRKISNGRTVKGGRWPSRKNWIVGGQMRPETYGGQIIRGGTDSKTTDGLGEGQTLEEMGNSWMVRVGMDQRMLARWRGRWTSQKMDDGRATTETRVTIKPEGHSIA